jgi:hypothetical protein
VLASVHHFDGFVVFDRVSHLDPLLCIPTMVR